MILDKILRKLNDFDDVVLSCSKNNSRQIKFADNEIVKTAVEETSNIYVFVSKDKKIITTTLKETDDKTLDKTVMMLKKMLNKVKAKEDYNGINYKKYKFGDVKDGYDKKIKDIDDIDYVEKGINAALKEGAKRTNGIFEVHDSEGEILTSKGINFKDRNSELYFSIRSFANNDESGHMNCVGRILNGFDVEKTGKISGEIARDANGVVNGAKGKYDVIFSPLAIAPILNSIGDAASIFSVESGMSFFENKIGKKISDVNIYDDGTLRNGL